MLTLEKRRSLGCVLCSPSTAAFFTERKRVRNWTSIAGGRSYYEAITRQLSKDVTVRRPSDVQHAPIRKAAPSVLSVALRLPLLICGRSLREDTRMKIRASTIFIRISSLAELFQKKFLNFYETPMKNRHFRV